MISWPAAACTCGQGGGRRRRRRGRPGPTRPAHLGGERQHLPTVLVDAALVGAGQLVALGALFRAVRHWGGRAATAGAAHGRRSLPWPQRRAQPLLWRVQAAGLKTTGVLTASHGLRGAAPRCEGLIGRSWQPSDGGTQAGRLTGPPDCLRLSWGARAAERRLSKLRRVTRAGRLRLPTYPATPPPMQRARFGTGHMVVAQAAAWLDLTRHQQVERRLASACLYALLQLSGTAMQAGRLPILPCASNASPCFTRQV